MLLLLEHLSGMQLFTLASAFGLSSSSILTLFLVFTSRCVGKMASFTYRVDVSTAHGPCCTIRETDMSNLYYNTLSHKFRSESRDFCV
jgi:hypothetical protein